MENDFSLLSEKNEADSLEDSGELEFPSLTFLTAVSTPLDSKGVETTVEKVFLAEVNGHPTLASQAVAGSLDARLRDRRVSDSKS